MQIRAGNKEGAAKLLNVVCKRYYPEDKQAEYLYKPDADSYTEIFPLHRNTLGANPNLKQNPGYADIDR